MKISDIKKLFQFRKQVQLPLRLTRRHVYILPTRSGLVFAFFLLAMLMAAVNYTNNPTFLLTFLLGSMAVLSAIHAHADMVGLRLEDARLLPAFCGGTAQLRLVFRAGDRPRHILEVETQGISAPLFSLAAQGEQEVSLYLPTVRRGLFPLEKLVVSTRYPLGLFRVWSPLILPVTGLVYPRPLPVDFRVRQLLGGTGEEGGSGPTAQFGEISEIRPYRPGDPPSHISWKASARGLGLFSKEFQSGALRTLFLDWQALSAFPYEERISRLAGLVLEGERTNRQYALRLPGQNIPAGGGAAHAHVCLEALALMPEEE